MKAAIAFICSLPLVALAGKDPTPIPDSCPVTRATAETRFTPPPPSRPLAPDSPWFWYGSDALYTSLASDGRWRGLKSPSGSRDKSFWFRKDAQWLDEVPYQLKVTFRKLGKAGPMFTVGRVTNAIMGKEVAMLLMLEFPTRGCWEVTANYKDAHTSFVTWVD
jgi:hypothetical protein